MWWSCWWLSLVHRMPHQQRSSWALSLAMWSWRTYLLVVSSGKHSSIPQDSAIKEWGWRFKDRHPFVFNTTYFWQTSSSKVIRAAGTMPLLKKYLYHLLSGAQEKFDSVWFAYGRKRESVRCTWVIIFLGGMTNADFGEESENRWCSGGANLDRNVR